MKKIILTITLLIATLSITGCGSATVTPEVKKAFDANATMYTQLNMRYNMSRRLTLVETTNFRVGVLIPVNSKVTLQDVNDKQIVFVYKGKNITLQNKAKYSGKNISEIFTRYFSNKKLDLSHFSKLEQKAIETGELKGGMSKKAVLVSLGYPPVHHTPTLEMNEWKFWKDRWTTYMVYFDKDKVVSGPK